MTYLDAAKGYIADVPEIVFYRCNQKVFHFNELTSFHFETKNDPIVIRCGHSRHPVAFIDALKEMNMEFESAAITSDLFAMSASRVTQKAEFSSLESKRYTVNQNNQIILPFLVKDKSVSIYRLTQAQAPAPGAFSYEVKDSQTILTFDPSDFGEDDDVRVAYKRIIQDAEVMTTTTRLKAVTGSVTVHWPVFEKDEENNLWVTVADRAELMGTNYVPIFDLANGDLGVTLPGDKDKYQLSDGELTLDVR